MDCSLLRWAVAIVRDCLERLSYKRRLSYCPKRLTYGVALMWCVAAVAEADAAPPRVPQPRAGSVLAAQSAEVLPQDTATRAPGRADAMEEAPSVPDAPSPESPPIWGGTAPPAPFEEHLAGPACESCGPTCSHGGGLSVYDAWGRVDYLLWWRKSIDTPPLVSTGPLTGDNTVLFGGNGVGGESESGGRAELGLWFDPCHYRGVVGRFFALGEEEVEFHSNGLTNVARPFIDVTPGSPAFGEENALIITAPGGPAGNVDVRMTSEVLGGDVFYRRALRTNACSRLDFLIGYQTSRINEDLTIAHQFTEGGVTITGTDTFDTRNEFHGVELGLLASRRDCRWTLDVLAKVGLGSMDETVTIRGMETREPPLTTTSGSLLALPSNIGEYRQDQFAAVPELGVNMSYELNCWLDFTVGYSLIYWSHVLRPGDQIDRTINATQTSGGTLDGQARPQFDFVDGEYWVQGINFGLTARR